MKIITSLDEFKQNAKEHNLVPVCISMLGDRQTPVSLYEQLVGEEVGFLLESAESTKHFGRYSFIGYNPLIKVTGYKDKTIVKYANNEEKEIKSVPIDALREILNSYNAVKSDKLPPFCGGMMGYLAYETVATFEKISNIEIEDKDVLAQTMLCQDIVILDHLKHTLYFIVWKEVSGDIEAIYQDACLHLHEQVNRIYSAVVPLGKGKTYTGGMIHQPDFELHKKKVAKIKEYIAKGETTQVVISAFYKRLIPAHPFFLYRRLRKENPSHYMFYLNFGDKKLVGASPEMLVKVENNIVKTFPIAGTRPRGATVAEDKKYIEELVNDPKENSEHDMLIDVGCDDLSKISKKGSVEVTRRKEIEFFSHVMHIVSEVAGELSEDKDSFDALQVCFPAGTVSGAPRVRAVEIIKELEEDKRDFYAGAVGYWDFNGNMDMCIAIRTMLIENDVATVRSGSGIVIESDEEAEAQEVRIKSQALLGILEDSQMQNYFD